MLCTVEKKPCNYCTYSSGDRSNFQKHINSIHKGQKFPCNACDYKANNLSNLNSHRKVIHGGFEFSCDKCKYQGSSRGSLTAHVRAVHLKLRKSKSGVKEESCKKEEFSKR